VVPVLVVVVVAVEEEEEKTRCSSVVMLQGMRNRKGKEEEEEEEEEEGVGRSFLIVCTRTTQGRRPSFASRLRARKDLPFTSVEGEGASSSSSSRCSRCSLWPWACLLLTPVMTAGEEGEGGREGMR
jgi:hypothetical protein